MPDRQIPRQPSGASTGGQFLAHRGDRPSDLVKAGLTSVASNAAQVALDAKLAKLNGRRLTLSADSKLPPGVARCVGCGRFASAENPSHECPQREMAGSGISGERATALAWAGFDSAHEVRLWSSTIDRLGVERAGFAKALGFSPVDAVRAHGAGVDFEARYRDATMSPSDDGRDAALADAPRACPYASPSAEVGSAESLAWRTRCGEWYLAYDSVRTEQAQSALAGDDGDSTESLPNDHPENPRSTPPSSEDYEFARPSEVGNVGADLKGSARHRWHEWRGLEAAELDGTAAEMITRDRLARLIPHSLMDSVDNRPLTSLAMHLAMRRFPPKPGGTPAARAAFLAEYTRIVAFAEAVASEISRDDPNAALDALNRFVIERISARRKDHGRYDETANLLVRMHHAIAFRRGRPSATSVRGQLVEFQKAAQSEPGDAGERVKLMLEGKSLADAFGLEKGTARRGFNAAELYVAHARRVGGRDLSMVTADPNRALRHVIDEHGLRGVQWGNTVTDGERVHHAARVVEAFDDLSDCLGLPPAMVGMGGTLGLAVGARGKAGALAHYEPDSKVINLTRKGGVGSLAHEWFHALDGQMAKKLKAGAGHPSEGCGTHWYELGGTKRDCSAAAAAEMAGRGHTTGEHGDRRVREAFTAMSSATEAFRRRLRYETVSEMRRDKRLSDATAKYWLAPHEMFARIGERMVQLKLADAGRANTYLSGVSNAGEGAGLWPTDDELRAMEPAFDELMAAIRESGVDD